MRQLRWTLSVVCRVFAWCLLFAACAGLFELSAGETEGLRISLVTDKASYAIGDEIHFEITFENDGDSAFRILVDDTFVGEHIQFADMEGNTYPYEGGYSTWSPKAGVFVGRTYLLQPGDKLVIRMDALVYDDYRVIFSNLFDRSGTDNFQELKKRNGLPSDFPDKYVCAGRIIPLGNAGTFRLTYIYETTLADKDWTFTTKDPDASSVDLLWIGWASSESVDISIQ